MSTPKYKIFFLLAKLLFMNITVTYYGGSVLTVKNNYYLYI